MTATLSERRQEIGLRLVNILISFDQMNLRTMVQTVCLHSRVGLFALIRLMLQRMMFFGNFSASIQQIAHGQDATN
jgi:hypothetical protein